MQSLTKTSQGQNYNPNIFNKVQSIDLPGHGGATPSGAKSIEDYASFISNIIKEINISDIHLCGHSMGGLVAMELAASNSKIFKSVNDYLEKVKKS